MRLTISGSAPADPVPRRKLRILIAHSFYRLAGGEDRYVQSQLELMRPHHTVALLQKHNQDLEDGLDAASQMTWSPRLTREVVQAIERFHPDVVHLHNAYPTLGPSVHLAARRCGVPLVMSVHNLRLRCPNAMAFTNGSPCRRCENGMYANAVLRGCFPKRSQATVYAASLWLHRFVMRLEERVALFVAPSAFIRDCLLQWGIGDNRIAMIRNFTNVRPDATPRVGRYGLYLGRLAVEKGLPELLRALYLAGDPPFRIAGAGPLELSLRQLTRDLGLKQTEFLGWRPQHQVAEIITEARYQVIPSLGAENAPLAAVEAIAEGRPLIVTRVGGLPELVEQGGGLVCEGGDVASLAAQIRRLVHDDALCRRAGASALQFASSELDASVHRRSLEAAYARAIDGGAPASHVAVSTRRPEVR